MASAAALASANKKIVAAETGTTSPEGAQTLLTNPNAGPEPSLTSAAPAAAAAPKTAAPEPPAESLPKATAPLKDISLQVTQAGKESVDVRVVQQGGEVHVSVHSGDAALTSGLRQGLSELQSRLEENGYRSEMWKPGTSSAPVAAPSPQSSNNNQSRSGDGQSQQGGSQQDSGRRNQNQSNQPRWVEELKSSISGGEQSSGGFYGIGS
jgi:hypothetical protein